MAFPIPCFVVIFPMQMETDRNMLASSDCDLREPFLEYDDEIVRVAPAINMKDPFSSSSFNEIEVPTPTLFPPEPTFKPLPVRCVDTSTCLSHLDDISTQAAWIRRKQCKERRRKRMAILRQKRLSGEISLLHCQRKYEGLQNHARYRRRSHGRFVKDDVYVDAY